MDKIEQEYDLNEESSRKVCELLGVEYTGPLRMIPAPALTRAMIAIQNDDLDLGIAHFVEHVTGVTVKREDYLMAKRIFDETIDFPLPLDSSTVVGGIVNKKNFEQLTQLERAELVGLVDEGSGLTSVVVRASRKGATADIELASMIEFRMAAVLCCVALRLTGVPPEHAFIMTRDEFGLKPTSETILGDEKEVELIVETVMDIATEIREDGTYFIYTPSVIKEVVEVVLETGIGVSPIERRRAKSRVIQQMRNDDIKFTEPVVEAFFNDLSLQLG